MRSKLALALGAVALLGYSSAVAGEFKSGVPEGGKIGAYRTTKCGGVADGNKVGSTFCYT